MDRDFDIEDYVNKRLLEITEPEERVMYKEIVGKLIKELYFYNETSYRELEERILNESSPQQSDYAIYLTLTDREHYDETDTFLYPMAEEDVKKKEILYEDIKEALENGEMLKLYTVFLETGASKVYQILHEDRRFHGVIQTQNREYRATFAIRRCKKYLKLVKNLYYIFTANYKPWSSVCEAYLMKLLDVCLCTSEEIKKGEIVQKIWVDFEEYADLIRYDMIPLWNLKQLEEKTSTYPEPGVDMINYEHQIFSHRLKPDCEYLVMNTDVEITNIRRVKGDLFITCPADTPQDWSLYQVSKENGGGNYLYPVLSNKYKESFSGQITEMYRRSIKTRAEMARLTEAFPYSDILEFRGYTFADRAPDGWEACNYNMDGFIQDEIRGGSARQVLMIQFAPSDMEYYLNEDIMSFLVTQIQKIFPEYLCIGELV